MPRNCRPPHERVHDRSLLWPATRVAPRMKRPLAIAHRGYSARYPENTLLGIRAAIDAGADIVEADARLSADGEVFCAHDPDLQRIAGQPIRIAETQRKELRAVRLRDGAPLMTLAEALEEARGRAPV